MGLYSRYVMFILKSVTELFKSVGLVSTYPNVGLYMLLRNTEADINPLTPNDTYSGRTAPLTSKRCILFIYSTNIGMLNVLNVVYTLRFFLFKMQFVL